MIDSPNKDIPIEEFYEWGVKYLTKILTKPNEEPPVVTVDSVVAETIDSLDLIEMLMECEERFFPGEYIPDHYIDKWKEEIVTFKDLLLKIKEWSDTRHLASDEEMPEHIRNHLEAIDKINNQTK